MQHDFSGAFQNVKLRPLEKEDIENLRTWRNEAKNTEFLRRVPYITKEMQLEWYDAYIREKGYYIFAIDEVEVCNRMVGSIALYDFRGSGCEYGRFMIGDPQAKGKKVGLNALVLCLHIGFSKMGVNRIIASVHENNISALKTDERAGFVITGKHAFVQGGNELEIEITKERFYAIHPQIKDLQI